MHGIDLTIGGGQRGHHQCAAQQAIGIANGRDSHIDLPALPREGWQNGGHDHGGHIFRAKLLARDIDAKPFEDIDHDLFGEGRIAQTIARAVQADDKAVSDQIIAAHPVELHQILDPDRRGMRGLGENDQDKKTSGEKADHHKYSVKLSRDRRAVRT